jgi:hypothetical protein
MNTLIQRNQLNTLCLTVKELSDPSLGENYLFRFTNDQSNQQILTQIPLAYSNSRYDLFTFMEGTDVDFPLVGDYTYEVFQVPDEDTLDPEDGIPVEIGKIEFNETITTPDAPVLNNETAVYEPS